MIEKYAIAFSLSKNWTYNAKKTAIDSSGGFDALLESSLSKFASVDLATAEKQWKKLQEKNGWLWIYGEKNYPRLLATIVDPPLVVFGLGRPQLDESNLLAVVGTRRPTPYGNRIAKMLSKELAEQGLTLVSGLARGIDSHAHVAAVSANQATVGVVAHGLDRLFPPENKRLASDIIEKGGTIVSEFPFGIEAKPGYFPLRNRIISGLCKATLVIEASQKSGTRHTVNHALEQCREVFAVPGPIDSEYSLFTNELIFTGAHMVRTCQDILDIYPDRKPVPAEKSKPSPTSELQEKILRFLDKDEPRAMEEFISTSKISLREVLQCLTELELEGKVQKQSDSMYILP